MSSHVIPLDQEEISFRASGPQQHRAEMLLGEAIIKNLIMKLNGKLVMDPDMDVTTVRWKTGQRDMLLTLLAESIPQDVNELTLHRLSIEALAEQLLAAWFKS